MAHLLSLECDLFNLIVDFLLALSNVVAHFQSAEYLAGYYGRAYEILG